MHSIKSSQQAKPLINARFVFIALQIIAILVCQYTLNYELPYIMLYAVLLTELAVNIAYYVRYKNNRAMSANAYFALVVIDIIFLTILLKLSGGASNPFVSLLLLPIAIASVTLPKRQLLATTLLSMCAYAYLLFTIDPHAIHHMNMEQHLIGMWLNFLLSALVVVVIVVSLLQAANKQEKMISRQREEQLRQEQLVSLGAAAAQFAHRLATPLGTAHLLSEEIQDIAPKKDPLYAMLDEQLAICRRHLDDFRTMAEQVKTSAKSPTAIIDLIQSLQQEVQLSFPQAQVDWQVATIEQQQILSEPILMPALLNLVQNAVNANKENNTTRLVITVSIEQNELVISIRDFGKGISHDMLIQLGVALIDSNNGLGLGVFLSHVTLEKLGGKLKLYNHPTQGAIAEISLPLLEQINA